MTPLRLGWAIHLVLLVASFSGCGLVQDRQSKVSSENESLNRMTTISMQQDVSPRQEGPVVANRMEVVTQASHSKGVRSVALSPDGRYILSGSFDWTAKLWDVLSRQVVKTFESHNTPWWPNNVGFSDDGMTAILADVLGTPKSSI